MSIKTITEVMLKMTQSLFDLSPEPGVAPTVGLLYATVKDTFERLVRLVENMTQQEIDYKGPSGDLNSTAQLVRHVAVVDLYWVHRIKSTPVPPDLQAEYGPMLDHEGRLPAVQGVPLKVLLSQYRRVQDMLREACLELTDDDLDREVPYEHGAKATVRWGIWAHRGP